MKIFSFCLLYYNHLHAMYWHCLTMCACHHSETLYLHAVNSIQRNLQRFPEENVSTKSAECFFAHQKNTDSLLVYFINIYSKPTEHLKDVLFLKASFKNSINHDWLLRIDQYGKFHGEFKNKLGSNIHFEVNLPWNWALGLSIGIYVYIWVYMYAYRDCEFVSWPSRPE